MKVAATASRDDRATLDLMPAFPIVPKLFTLVTTSSPKSQCQMRFAITRAVSGWPELACQSVSSFHPPVAAGIGGVVNIVPGLVNSPFAA